MTSSTDRCYRCHGGLEAVDRFCGQCGAPRPVPPVAPGASPASPPGPDRPAPPLAPGRSRPDRPARRRLPVMLAVLAIAALAAGAVVVIRSASRGPIPPSGPGVAGPDTGPSAASPPRATERLREALVLTNTAHRTGRMYPDGKPEYAWVAHLDVDGPPAQRREALGDVSFVRYVLHPSFRPHDVVVVADGAEAGFPLSTSGWGTFTLRAEVHFRDGTMRVLTHELRF